MLKHNAILPSLAVEKVPPMARVTIQQAVLANVVAVAFVNVSVHVDGLKVVDGEGLVVVWAFGYSPVSGVGDVVRG